MPTIDELEAYKLGRTAISNLRKDKNFKWWQGYAGAVVAARGEAMRVAGTNSPIGKAYNLQHAKIMKRERLDIIDANTRKDAVAMIDNLHHPLDSRRLKGVLAWRASLTEGERQRLNHPSSIMRRWKADTEPIADREAAQRIREAKEPKDNPHLAALADTEGERDEARKHAQALRELLGRVLDEAELPESLRQSILKALADL
jgi:hypothetical protein